MSFSHRDGYLTVSPIEGPNQGKARRVLSGTKISFDPGGKASYMKQFEQVPFAIVRGAAEPKLELDLDSAVEACALRAHVGQIGGYRFLVAIVWVRPGFPTKSFQFLFCELENGGGFESDESKGVSSKLSIKLLDAIDDGVSVYARRYAQ